MGIEGGQSRIPEDERKRIVSALIKMMDLGIGAVYGDEDEGAPESAFDCQGKLGQCHARCCKLNFALTRDEAALGLIRHNPSRPFFIARDEDGYCSHMDRRSYACTVYEDRPLRCRRYDCGGEQPVL